jgi:hypothetical protein
MLRLGFAAARFSMVSPNPILIIRRTAGNAKSDGCMAVLTALRLYDAMMHRVSYQMMRACERSRTICFQNLSKIIAFPAHDGY